MLCVYRHNQSRCPADGKLFGMSDVGCNVGFPRDATTCYDSPNARSNMDGIAVCSVCMAGATWTLISGSSFMTRFVTDTAPVDSTHPLTTGQHHQPQDYPQAGLILLTLQSQFPLTVRVSSRPSGATSSPRAPAPLIYRANTTRHCCMCSTGRVCINSTVRT